MLRGLGKGWLWGVLSVSGVFLHSACSSDEADAIRRAKLEEGCLINSDCSQSPDQLICAFQRCHIQCNSSADCDTGLRCVLGTKPEHVCLLKEEQDCKLSSDCPDPLVCGPDGECRDQCKTNSDCVDGQECTDHMCADSAELVNGRLPDKLSDGGADTGSPPPGVGFPCEYNSDCQGTLVCKGGSCKEECKADTDCSPGIQCDPATHRCLPKTSDAGADTSTDVGPDVSLDGGSPCKLNSDCAASLVCRFGTCEPECKTDVDCTNGKHCVNQSCVYSAPDGAPPGYGTPCTHTSQCSSGLVCVPGGVCAYECLNSGDCDMAAGFCCLSHFCVKGGASCNPDGGSGGSGGTGGTGGSGGTGGADAGKACTTNAECSDNVVCNGVELCVGGHCTPPGPVCDDQNPCTTDACNASTGQCEHTATVTPVDQDNDGHYAIACGSGADDCDDKNPKVFAGAPELCDQLDNNCNGYADEALWKAQPVTTLATASYYQGKQIFDNVPGGPAVIRMGDGSFRVLAVANDTSVGAIRGYKLDAALTLQGSATDLATGPDAVWGLGAATDGTSLAFGTTRYDTPTTSQTATVFRTDGAFGTPIGTPLATVNGYAYSSGANLMASRPDIAWNGSEYVMVWYDRHADNSTQPIYAATMTAAGVATTPHLLDPGSPLAFTSYGAQYSPHVAAGPTSTLATWYCSSQSRTCTAIGTKNLSGLATPITPTSSYLAGDTERPLDAIHVGTSFIVLARNGSSAGYHLYRIHESTGAQLASIELASAIAAHDAHIAPVAGGILLTVARGNYVSFAWLPETLNVPSIVLTDLDMTTTTSAAWVTPVDATTFAMAWQDGSLRARLVKCQP